MASNKYFRIGIGLIILFAILHLNGCSYSFTGASVPPHLKTIAIPVFSDRSGSGEFGLGDKLTNGLIKKFIEDNTLSIADKLKSDCVLEGTVSSLTDAPTVVTGSENISTRRLTITVRVIYKDLIKKTTIFEKNFSNYGDYQTDGDVYTARQTAIESAVEKINEDILLGVVSNW
jgi:hypothetical protein